MHAVGSCKSQQSFHMPVATASLIPSLTSIHISSLRLVVTWISIIYSYPDNIRILCCPPSTGTHHSNSANSLTAPGVRLQNHPPCALPPRKAHHLCALLPGNAFPQGNQNIRQITMQEDALVLSWSSQVTEDQETVKHWRRLKDMTSECNVRPLGGTLEEEKCVSAQVGQI